MATITKTIGSGKDYSTISAWQSDLNNGAIYSSGDIAVGEVYSHTLNYSPTIAQGATTGLSQIILRGATQHDGTAGTGVVLTVSSTRTLAVTTSVPTIIEWLEFASGTRLDIYANADNVNLTVRNCLIHDFSNAVTVLYVASGRTNATLNIYNNFFWNLLQGSSLAQCVRVLGSSNTYNVFNNTAYNIQGYGILRSTGTTNAKNNLFLDCAVACLSGTFTTEDYNVITDTSSTGANSIESVTALDQIVSATNLHLKGSSVARGAGDDLSATFTTDIDGDTRTAWDVGADEYIPIPINETGTGGIEASGLSTIATFVTDNTTGGVVADGLSTVAKVGTDIAEGGVVLDGLSLVAKVGTETTAGGVLMGGTTPDVAILLELAAGGVQIDGLSTITTFATNYATGGILANGSTLNSIITTALTEGGVVLAGQSLDGLAFFLPTEGGVFAGGLSLPEVVILTSGGVVADGISTVAKVGTETTEGGVLADGLSLVSKVATETTEGGIQANGISPVEIVILTSGGVLVSGQLFRFPRYTAITVPEGTVSEDMGFYLAVRLTGLPNILGLFEVTDSEGNVLAHEVRQTDEVEGTVVLFFRCDLKAAQDNTFTIHSGG